MRPNKPLKQEQRERKKKVVEGKTFIFNFLPLIVSPFVSGNAMPTPFNMWVVTLRLCGELRLLRKRSMSVEKEFKQHKHLPHLLPVLAKTNTSFCL